jgi:CHAT domain-containing protein
MNTMIKYIKKTASLVLFTVLVFCTNVKAQDIETVNSLENKGRESSYSLSWFYPAAAANDLNYNNTLFTKGFLLRTATGMRDAIYSSGNQVLIGQYEQLGNLRKEISTLQQKPDYNKEYVASLESRADSLDKALIQASVAFRDLKADMSMTWHDVQKQLKPEDAAIEFVSFSLYNKKWTDTTLYAALVLRKGMKSPVWIPLFNETELQACLKTSKDNDASSKRDELRNNIIYRTFTRLQEEHKGLELYKLVWEKLEKELQGVKNVYYSPSGLLHKVSFAAIPVNEADITGDNITTSGKYARLTTLSDKYNMHLVTSTREIKRLKTEHPETWSPKDSVAIYGGLQYYLHEDTMRPVAEAYRSSGTRGVSWSYLDGTEKEAKEVEALMREKSIKTTLFTGIYGNEESFKHLSGTKTKVILLSTHGFFLSDVEHNRDLLQSLGGGNQHDAVENPLLRSGLILSGGGTKWDEPGRVTESGPEDGILTAEEVSRLNLTNTKLVVLSAGESGLGDVKNSEGVFGLQRAFKLAGVETIIMSLWQISDNATNLLIPTFFTEWLSGKTKHDAFKIAQTKVREKFAAPYYWAAFVMLD